MTTLRKAEERAVRELATLPDPSGWGPEHEALFAAVQSVLAGTARRIENKPVPPKQQWPKRNAPARRMSAKRSSKERELWAAKDVVRVRSGWRCEATISPDCTGELDDVHHRKNRSQGGSHDPVNLLGVCRACHDWIGENRTEAHELGLALHQWDDEAKGAVE